MVSQNQVKDLKEELKDWLNQGNSRTMPPELDDLQKDFLQRFPRDQLNDLTLETYTLGKRESFCYWIEFKTRKLGSVSGGNASKWGIFWSRADQKWKWNISLQSDTAEDAFLKLKTGLLNLLEAAEKDQFDHLDVIGSTQLGPNRNGLRAKPLSLYFPDKFLPISNPYHLAHFLNLLGQQPHNGLHAKNRQLLTFLRGHPEFAGMDTHSMMRFLYETMPPGARRLKSAQPDHDDHLDLPEEIVQLATLAETTRNLILYGPPGTGKTYIVNRFARFYLSEQLRRFLGKNSHTSEPRM